MPMYAHVIGVIDSDIKTIDVGNGKAFLSFQVKTRMSYVKDKTKPNEWWNVELFASNPQQVLNLLRKGEAYLFSGAMETREYTDNNGQKKYMTRLKAQNFDFLPRITGSQSGLPMVNGPTAGQPSMQPNMPPMPPMPQMQQAVPVQQQPVAPIQVVPQTPQVPQQPQEAPPVLPQTSGPEPTW